MAGTISTLDLLLVVTNARNIERTAVTILGNRMSASALLIKALGGGWKSSDLPDVSPWWPQGRVNNRSINSQEERERSGGMNSREGK
jgi:hypothetical protein